MIPTMTFWKKHNYGNSKKISVRIFKGGGGMTRWGTGGVQGSEAILYDTILVESCHYTFVQTHRICPNPQCPILSVNPNVNYGLWVIMMNQCQFIHCNKCTTLVQDVWYRRRCWGEGEGIFGNSLYFLLNFAVKLNLL